MKYTAKIESADPASFHVLDPEKAKRLSAKSLYIPSVADVREAINAIPAGKTKTIVELRKILAIKGNADTACPAKVNGYWKWMAFAAEEEGGEPLPWWRVLKDGKVSRHMPGGVDAHRARLKAEGVTLP
ncbi:MAG: MGMT family protein [Armatimonadetes bacterium]|nr:MGMT family protein [Armatimonadota bacterium]